MAQGLENDEDTFFIKPNIESTYARHLPLVDLKTTTDLYAIYDTACNTSCMTLEFAVRMADKLASFDTPLGVWWVNKKQRKYNSLSGEGATKQIGVIGVPIFIKLSSIRNTNSDQLCGRWVLVPFRLGSSKVL